MMGLLPITVRLCIQLGCHQKNFFGLTAQQADCFTRNLPKEKSLVWIRCSELSLETRMMFETRYFEWHVSINSYSEWDAHTSRTVHPILLSML